MQGFLGDMIEMCLSVRCLKETTDFVVSAQSNDYADFTDEKICNSSPLRARRSRRKQDKTGKIPII